MQTKKFVKSLIVIVVDSLLLALLVLILLIDVLTTRDIIWILAAMLGIFIFSARLGSDIRNIRTRKTQ